MLSAKTSDTECCCAHKSGLFAFWLVVLATAFDDAPSVPYLHAHVVWHRLITGTQRYHDQGAIRSDDAPGERHLIPHICHKHALPERTSPTDVVMATAPLKVTVCSHCDAHIELQVIRCEKSNARLSFIPKIC